VLVASDLPATYTESPRDTVADAQTLKLAAKLPACKKLAAFMKATQKSSDVKSDDFSQGQTSIDNTVTVFPSAAKAAIKKVQDVSIGDQAIAYEGPVAITESDGTTSTLGFGNLVIRVGRGVAVYSYNHDAQTSITTDLQNAVSSSGGRLQSALAG